MTGIAGRRLLAAFVLTAAVVLGGISTAHAARFKLIGTGIGPAVTDGYRYMVYQPTPAVTRVVDTIASTSRDFPTPDGCATQYSAGGLIAIGGSQVLWQCSDRQPLLLDIASGNVHAIPGYPPPIPYSGIRACDCGFDAVGSQWIAGWEYGYHHQQRIYINWHTGERRDDQPASPRQVPDLNRPGLARDMCAPLRRKPVDHGRYEQGLVARYDPYQYKRPYGLAPSVNGGFALQRCGRQSTVLRCKRGCGGGDALLSAGYITWMRPEQGYVYAYVPGTRTRYRWHVRLLRFTHTRTRIIGSRWATFPPTGDPYTAWRIYAARFPA